MMLGTNQIAGDTSTFKIDIVNKRNIQTDFCYRFRNVYIITGKFFFRVGPLVRHWCMRFEAKHNYFKTLAHGMFNFKNIAKTLAERHQKFQCYWLSQDGGFLRPSIEVGPGTINVKPSYSI